MDNINPIVIIVFLSLFVAGLCFLLYRKPLGSSESFESPVSEPVDTPAAMPSCAGEMKHEKSAPVPSDPFDVPSKNILDDEDDPVHGNTSPSECFPKAHLNPSDLLPSSEATEWSHANPVGKGELDDQNFLSAGFHVGINTVGQSLRNANMQIRSEPLIPRKKLVLGCNLLLNQTLTANPWKSNNKLREKRIKNTYVL